VTGGGQIAGDPLFSALGDLLSDPALILSAGGTDQATFGFVIHNGGDPNGNLQYQDHGADLRVKATSYNALVIGSGPCGPNTHAQFSGQATVNDMPNQNFEVEVDDCGEAGTADTFAIRVTGPSVFYLNGPRTLEGGNIQIH
jgi:hypothetical protein